MLKKWKKMTELKPGGKFFCGNLCVQQQYFYSNLYIIDETTNMQNLEKHSNPKG